VNAGDIVFSVIIEPHDRFIRKGADLYYSQKISLKEALVGTHF
jgi:DnaJ-class molecular chaperone